MTSRLSGFSIQSPRRLSPRVERPQLRSTYQFAGEARGRAGVAASEAFRRARDRALEWMREKFGDALPREADEGVSFTKEMPGGGSRIECVGLPGDGIWSLRFVHPDLPFGGRLAVPGRSWTTEVALHHDAQQLRLAVHVTCASQPGTDEPIRLTRPGVLGAIAQELDLFDIRPLSKRAWRVADEAGYREFSHFVTDPERQMPVHVITTLEPGRQFEFRLPTRHPVDPDHLANTLFGLAHVVVLERDQAREWTRDVGRDWGLFGGAVRTYFPGLDLSEGACSDHPLVLPDRMARYQGRTESGFKAFGSFLERRTREWTAGARFGWGPCLFTAAAQQRQMEIARRSAVSEVDLRKLIDDQAETYERQLAEKDGEIESWFARAEEAEGQRDYYRDQNRRLSAQLDVLRDALRRVGNEGDGVAIPEATSYEDLPSWVAEQFVGRLVLHPRAERRLKEARFEDPVLVFEALRLLAGHYRNSKLGVEGAWEAFEDDRRNLSLELGGSIAIERAGEKGKTYFVNWPPHSEEKAFLDSALKKGSNKDQRYTLRIYFFWDEDSQQVVVGSLPAHLENRMT